MQPFGTKIYLSRDEILDFTDIYLRSKGSGAGPFSAYKTRLESAAIAIPEDTPPATYYVLLVVDGEGEVDEFNEDNNTMATHDTLVVRSSGSSDSSSPDVDIADGSRGK